MDDVEKRVLRSALPFAAAAVCPFLAMSAYLAITQLASMKTGAFADYTAMAVSIAAGVIFILFSPGAPARRIGSLVLYVPIYIALLTYYGLWFMAVFFHEGP
jgi:hypothetical protein